MSSNAGVARYFPFFGKTFGFSPHRLDEFFSVFYQVLSSCVVHLPPWKKNFAPKLRKKKFYTPKKMTSRAIPVEMKCKYTVLITINISSEIIFWSKVIMENFSELYMFRCCARQFVIYLDICSSQDNCILWII